MSKSRFAALDTTFLLALAVGAEACQTVVDWLMKINVYPLVSPTVLQELVDLENFGGEAGEVATLAKNNLSTWGILTPSMDPKDHGIAQIIARRLVEKGCISDEAENDGLVLAEAGIQECTVFLTYRAQLAGASSEAIKLVLLEQDVAGLLVVSPDHIVEFLDPNRKVGAHSHVAAAAASEEEP